ncbi:MAG: DNA repair protein RecO [Spirochaetia bacterium]
MQRNLKTNAIILRNRKYGEMHKIVTMLTPEHGLIDALAYGGYKGKLKSLTNPFHICTVSIYSNPVKQTNKISDVDVIDYLYSMREDMKRFLGASLFAEIILRSYAGGEGESYSLMEKGLYTLASTQKESIDFVIIQFIRRYMKILGEEPQFYTCQACGAEADGADLVYYDSTRGGFYCENCASIRENPLSGGARAYLRQTGRMPFSEAVKVKLDAKSLVNMKHLFFRMIESIIESQLNTLGLAGL